MRVDYGRVPGDAVWGGADTHADTNWLSVVDATGRELFSGEFSTGALGYRALASRLVSLGAPVPVGVECTGTYGAGLARELAREGLVRSCTSLANIALAMVRKAPDPVRSRLERLGTAGIMRACACWEGGDGLGPVSGAAC